jgi:hypothetical protein
MIGSHLPGEDEPVPTGQLAVRNLVCKDRKDETRMQRIELIAKAPMLYAEMMTATRDQTSGAPWDRSMAGKAKTHVESPKG